MAPSVAAPTFGSSLVVLLLMSMLLVTQTARSFVRQSAPSVRRTLHIAGLFSSRGQEDEPSEEHSHLDGILTALEMALDMINNRSDILPTVELRLSWNDSKVSDEVDNIGLIQHFISWSINKIMRKTNDMNNNGYNCCKVLSVTTTIIKAIKKTTILTAIKRIELSEMELNVITIILRTTTAIIRTE